MVSKCANPACNNGFVRLDGGRLFRFDLKCPGGLKTEFFWLCGSCAATMHMHLGPNSLPIILPAKSVSCREQKPLVAA